VNGTSGIGKLTALGRAGTPHLVQRPLHDVEIRVESYSPAASEILDQYLGYLEGGWGGPPRLTLRFRVFERPGEEIARLPDYAPPGTPREAAGLEVWRDGVLGYARSPGAAFARADLASLSADLFFDPLYARNAFLVRDLLSVYLVEMLRRDGAFPLHSAAGVKGGDAVIVLGPPGAGKTTLALGMSRAGLSIATDDWLLYRLVGGAVEAAPLIRCISLPCDQVDDPGRYEVLAHHREPPIDKYIVTRESLGPPSPPRFRPRVVVYARREDACTSEVGVVRPDDLLGIALTQSALASGDQASIRRHLAALRVLLGSCTCLELAAGHDIGRDPAVGGRLLARWLARGG
jgi:hypothetical protein